MKRFLRIVSWSAGCSLAALVAAPVAAQSSDSERDGAGAARPHDAQRVEDGRRSQQEEIVVTATRRDATVEDVPFNIQAISGDSLDAIGARSAVDFARIVPGLTFTDEGARDGYRPFLRGLRSGDDYGLVPTTSTYVDDIQVNRPGTFTPLDLRLLDVDRIEILRGPQGTLYGGGSIGGAIRYITRKPDLSETSARARGLGSVTQDGGFNYEMSGMMNAPIVQDRLGVRLSAGYYDNDGIIDNVRLGKSNIDDEKTLSLRAAVRFEPSENLTMDLTYSYQRSKFGEASSYSDYLGKYNVDYYHPGFQINKDQLASLTLSYDMGFATLTSSTSYFHTQRSFKRDTTAQIRDRYFGMVGGFVGVEIPEFSVFTTYAGKAHSWTEEVRLTSSGDGPLDWIIGGYWYDSKFSGSFQEHVPVPFPGQAQFENDFVGALLSDDKEFLGISNEKFRQKAVFGEIGYRVTPQWRLSLGGRYFDYNIGGTSAQVDQWNPAYRDAQGYALSTPDPADINSGSASEKGTTFRLNSSYDLSKDALIYATVASSYRPGGFNQASSSNPIPPEYRAYKSDEIISYEVGGKASLADRRVYVAGALYYIDWSDMQTQIQLPTLFGLRGNAGKTRAKGLELEVNTVDVLTPGLRIGLGYAFTSVELAERVNGFGMKGERAPFVPRHSGSLMIDYGWDIGGDWKAGVNLLTTYTGGSYTDFGPIKPDLSGDYANTTYLRMRPYSLTNMSVRLQSDDWSIRVFADNVFNKTADLYVSQREAFTDYRPASYIDRVANRPRTIGVEVTRNF